MSRIPGDKNYTEREQRLIAEKKVLEAKNTYLKAKLEAEKLRKKEISKRV